MKPLKQALILFRTEPLFSLLLGAFSLILVFGATSIPYFGAWVMTLGLLSLLVGIFHWQNKGHWQFFTAHFKNILPSLILASLLLMPTGILLGSSVGVLQKTDQLLLNLPLAFFLIYICLFFFINIGHSLLEGLRTPGTFLKSMDRRFAQSLRRPFSGLVLCFYLSVILLLGLLLWGLGLVIALPLILFATYYSQE